MKWTAALDVGGTSIKGALISKEGEIGETLSCPTAPERGEKAMLNDMAELVIKMAKGAGIAVKDLCGLGIGLPGCISADGRTLVFANNLHLAHSEVAKLLEKELYIPVFLDNDANCAALAEQRLGGAKDHENALLLTLGTGVGGGIIVGGKLLAGTYSSPGELGHMVIHKGGEPCTCGRFGCLETYASATALIRETRKAMRENNHSLLWEQAKILDEVDGKTVFDAAEKGDKTAQRVLQEYTENLAEGIGNLVNIFRPSVVLIGGGICAAGDALFVPLREAVKPKCYASEVGVKVPEILPAMLGNKAGLIGAAMLCFER